MEVEFCVPKKPLICECCLSKVENIELNEYVVKSEELKSILKIEILNLCIECTTLAQDADTFIYNVNKGKVTISSLHNTTVKSELEEYIVKNEIDIEENTIKETNIKCETENTLDEDDDNISDNQDDTEMIYGTELNMELKSEEIEHLQIGTEDDSGMLYCSELNNDFKSENCEESRDKQNDNMLEIIYLNKNELDDVRAAMLKDNHFVDAKYKCYDCIKYYAHEDTFNKHMKMHREDSGKYICEICKQRLKTKDRYLIHKKNHFRWYKCSLCDVMKLTRDVILNHYAVKHTDLKIDRYCLLCDKWFKNARAFQKHNWYKHSGVKGIECEYCNKVLADRNCLRTHIKSKHPEKNTEPISTDKFSCECGKEFPTRGRLKAHSLVHKNIKEFLCVECDKAFKTRSMLRAHLNSAIHTKYHEYRYVCDKCNKRFINRRAMESHINKEHLKVRPHQCQECDKSFLTYQRLKDHIKQVHEGHKPPPTIPCKICNKLFRTNHTLKEHLRTHTGERPYECKICGSKFTQSGVLRTHQKIVHLKINRKTRLSEIDSKLL